MTGLLFLEAYAGQTTDALIALATTHTIDSLVLAFEQGLENRGAPFSDAERVVLAVEAIEREVNNGGYHQFFLNSSREHAPFVVESLERIGCPRQAAIAARAIAALGPGADLGSRALRARAKADDPALEDALEACDTDYYACDEPIADRLFAFVVARRAEIDLPGGARRSERKR